MTYTEVSIVDELKNDYLSYCISTLNRAIPSALDGLKVSQRRIIQTGLEDNITKWVKTAKYSGMVMSKYHPHGSAGLVIQGLSDPSSYLNPLLLLHGNPGGYSVSSRQKLSNDNPASERYTESALSQFALSLFDGALNTRPNYDGTLSEVSEFSTKLPLALINPASGIGTGYATNTCAFPASNIVKAIININDKSAAIKALGWLDIPWNTNITKSSDMLSVHQEGKGSIQLIGEWKINDKEIIITKLASGNVEQFCQQIKSGLESDKISGISKLSDLSSKDIQIKITCKRNSAPQEVINQLLQHTNLANTFSVNNTFVVNGMPKQLTPYELLVLWYESRVDVLTKRFTFDLQELESKLKIKEAIYGLLDKMRAIVDLIIDSESAEVAYQKLQMGYGLDDAVIVYILNLSLKQLTRFSKSKLAEEIEIIKSDIFKLTLLLSDKKALHAFICEQATDCASYCAPRVSKVIDFIFEKPKAAAALARPKRAKKLTSQQRIFNAAREYADKNNYKLPSFNGMKNSEPEKLYRHLVLWLYAKKTKGVDRRKVDQMNEAQLKAILKKLHIL